jgi:hypothetical protein
LDLLLGSPPVVHIANSSGAGGGRTLGMEQTKNNNTNVTDLLKAFLDNGSVNTFQRATMEAVSQWTNVIARC